MCSHVSRHTESHSPHRHSEHAAPRLIPESETAPQRAHDPVTNRRPAHSARDRHTAAGRSALLTYTCDHQPPQRVLLYFIAPFSRRQGSRVKATNKLDWSAIGVRRSGGARGDHSDAPRRCRAALRAAREPHSMGHRAIRAGGRRARRPRGRRGRRAPVWSARARVAAFVQKSVFVRVRAQNLSPPAVPAASLTGLRRRLRRAQKSAISRAPGSP